MLAGYEEGHMNYEKVLHEMIVQNVKLIDKQISGYQTGSGQINAGETQGVAVQSTQENSLIYL